MFMTSFGMMQLVGGRDLNPKLSSYSSAAGLHTAEPLKRGVHLSPHSGWA